MALNLDLQIKLTPELRQFATRIGFAALVLALAAYTLVVMPLMTARKLDAQIIAETQRTKRQQTLMPAIAGITASLQNATLAELLPPRQEPVPRAQVYLMTDQLAQMATACGLEPLGVTLNPASMALDPDSIQAQGVFSGQLEGVRGLLAAISRMPSLSRLERVEIRAVDGHLEMLVQMRIALGN